MCQVMLLLNFDVTREFGHQYSLKSFLNIGSWTEFLLWAGVWPTFFLWRSRLLLVENFFPHSALRHFEQQPLLSSPLSDILCCFVHYLSELKTQNTMFTFQHSIFWHRNAMASQHSNGFILFQEERNLQLQGSSENVFWFIIPSLRILWVNEHKNPKTLRFFKFLKHMI